MKKAGDDLASMKDAHAQAGEIVAREAESRAPKRSGALASTIRPSRQAKRAQVVAGKAKVPYAGPIHWGWPARGIKATPFLWEAGQATESQWLPQYLRAVQDAVDKVKGA